MQIVQKIMVSILMISTLHAGVNVLPLPAKPKGPLTKNNSTPTNSTSSVANAIMSKSKEVLPAPNENSEALAYEDALSSAVSHYVADLQAADKDEAKIMTAMEKYQTQLNAIDQKYPTQAQADAAEHLQKMTEQKAKCHNFELAYQHLKTEFAKELDPYWKAQQEIWQASWNREMDHDPKLRKMANEVTEAATHSLEFQYSKALTKFQTAMKKLNQQNGY